METPTTTHVPLTHIEMSCLEQCAEGNTDAEIGVGFGFTPAEVNAALLEATLKLSSPNRLVAIIKAIRLGILNVETCS